MAHRNLQPSRAMDLALPGIFRQGASVRLKGSLIDGMVKHFTLQLVTPNGIAMFMYVPVNGEILFNSLKGGRWELEERHINPFKSGNRFHIKIKHKNDFLVVKVNSVLICHFYHRDMPSHIRTLAIRGDIRIEDVHFKRFKHQSRDGPAVVIHSNLPPPSVAQQFVVPPPPPQQQILVQPQTIIQQQTTVYNQPLPQTVTIEEAAAAQVLADGPPPYAVALEYPALPKKE